MYEVIFWTLFAATIIGTVVAAVAAFSEEHRKTEAPKLSPAADFVFPNQRNRRTSAGDL
jgi:hypothetical protein